MYDNLQRGAKLDATSLKLSNIFKIGPNDIDFFEKLRRLVYKMTYKKNFRKTAIDRNREEKN